MELLYESIIVGALMTWLIYIALAIFAVIAVIINHYGGIPYVTLFFILISIGVISAIYYYQGKQRK